jgi:hypothetical protein
VPPQATLWPESFLTSLESLDVSSPHFADQLEKFWTRLGEYAETYLATEPDNKNQILNLFDKYLDTGPAKEIYSVKIAHADFLLLQKLNCAYDVWAVLAGHGIKRFIRGKTTPWETHEKPLVDSYRLEVKARLARRFEEGISLFKLAARAAEAGTTRHCKNRARLLLALAAGLEAHSESRKNQTLSEAAARFRQGRKLAKGTDLEPALGFLENTCKLRDSEITWELDEGLAAFNSAMSFARQLPNPETLFKRPNPWTSFKDFQNEQLFIVVLRLLRERQLSGLEQAAANLRKIIADCGESGRRLEMRVRLLAVEAVQALQAGQQPYFEQCVDDLSDMRTRSGVSPNTKKLIESVTKAPRTADPRSLFSEVLPLFSPDLVRDADRNFLQGAPLWLQHLARSNEREASRAFLSWYSRVVVDWAWSVHEKNAAERAQTPSPRPEIRNVPLDRIASLILRLHADAEWGDETGALLRKLGLEIQSLVAEETTEDDFSKRAKLIVRETEKLLLPMVMSVERQVDGSIHLKRLDGSQEIYKYSQHEIDRRSVYTDARRVYLKPRFRFKSQRPYGAGNRRLYLYPAPSCPEFWPACLIVEGPSDASFFETMLDRMEPGWRAIHPEHDSRAAIIEVRASGGADRVPEVYRQTRQEGRFHTVDPRLEAGAERIVVAVDADRASLFEGREDVSRARHKLVLNPDLERVAPVALYKALELSLSRILTEPEKDILASWTDLSSREFELQIAQTFGIYLKRQPNPRDQFSFANRLAFAFPGYEPGAPWAPVWDACHRLLQLASGPVRVRELQVPKSLEQLSKHGTRMRLDAGT